jgi:acetyltransferase-like isoleucine patch superfamily enzyme
MTELITSQKPRALPLRVGFAIDTLQPGAGTENQLALLLRSLDCRRILPFVCCLRNGVNSYPTTTVGKNVYIGCHSLIGRCHIGDNVQIGSRVSILSGRRQHSFHESDNTNFEEKSFSEILIGENSWVGEAAVVMADLGNGCGVGAGSVVVHPVAEGTIVAGNPARQIGVRGK